MAGKQLYFETELNNDWKRGCDAAIKVGRLRNHRKGTTERNDKKLPLWISCDLMEQGVIRPEDITDDNWLDLIERYRHGQTRSGKILKEISIKKRREGLIQILKGLHLDEILHFVNLWQPKKEEDIIRWWSNEEMEAMTQTALQYISKGKFEERAIAHLLHFSIAPRRSDSALFLWKNIDLVEGMITFPASKNRKRCQNRIEPRFIEFLSDYKKLISTSKGGDVYVFPSSRAQISGTTKDPKDYISAKSIAKWLAFIRNSTTLRNGDKIRPYPPHSYRHSLAMRYLNTGSRYEDVSGILGDTVATIERYYSTLIYTEASEDAFRRAHPNSHKEPAIATAQPEWMMREVGFRTPNINSAVRRNRGSDSTRVVDAGGFEPPATWLQTRCSSKLS